MTATALEPNVATPNTFELELRNTDEAPGLARRFTADVLTRWGHSQAVIADAKLIVSELVTNAIQHTGSRLVTVSCEGGAGGARIAVHDFSREVPVLVMSGRAEDECGRGLHLVNAISRGHWGIQATPAGKAVWVELRADRPKPIVAATPPHAGGGES